MQHATIADQPLLFTISRAIYCKLCDQQAMVLLATAVQIDNIYRTLMSGSLSNSMRRRYHKSGVKNWWWVAKSKKSGSRCMQS